MQRPALFAVVTVLALAAIGVLLAMGSFGAPPLAVPDPTAPTTTEVVEANAERAVAPRGEVDTAASRRDVEIPAAADVDDDPEIRAALTGFRGRVVDARGAPMADSGVRLYRGAMDSILPPGLDVMAEEASWQPSYVAAETRTAADGKFLLEGVWPRAFFLLLAGIGTDAPSHRLLQHSPAPGEVIDLGDIVLEDCGVLVGVVVDEDGQPVADALVRAIDLPGQLIAAAGIERFDPQGALLIREQRAPMQVVELPPWVAVAFEQLPIPATRSGADGSFRLSGVVPGSNYVATTKANLLGDAKPAVKVTAGQTVDLGSIELRDGEEVGGMVVDTAGKPVAGADVLAATTATLIPFDFARRIGVTDDRGRFVASGFGPGKVTVAARRSQRDPWVLAEPQSVRGDVRVTLPGVASLTVRVARAGELVRAPRLKLMPSDDSNEALVLAMIGFVRPVDLKGRTETRADGSIFIDDLPNGHYVLLASTEGSAVATAEVDLTKGATHVDVELKPSNAFTVRVLGPEDKPIRNAAIYVRDSGRNRGEMPIHAGRTDARGELVVTAVASDKVRVSAEHPRWGATHGEREPGPDALVLHMVEPGWIEGVLTESGKAPAPGAWSVAAEFRRGPGQRGATEAVPALAMPALDGKFTLRALQPGHYYVIAFPSLTNVHSPGGVFELMQTMNRHDTGRAGADVVSGAGAVVKLETTGTSFEGPAGSLAGTVQVDGQLATGYRVQIWSEGRSLTAPVDAAGRFAIERVPAGNVNISVTNPDDDAWRGGVIWSDHFPLAEAERRELTIVVETTSVSGIVIAPDGAPAAEVQVQLQVRPLNDDARRGSASWRHLVTDAQGQFRIDRAVAGIYRIEVEGSEERRMRGELLDVRAEPGRPVENLRLQLRSTVEVRGRVDTSVFTTPPEWMWLTIHTVDPGRPDNPHAGQQVEGMTLDKEGTFTSHGLDAGTYNVLVHANEGEEWKTYASTEQLVVPAGGLSGVLLRLRPLH